MISKFWHHAGARLLAGALCIASLTGCETLQPNDTAMKQDVYEVKTKLNEYLEKQDSAERQVKYSLTTARETSDAQAEALKTRMADLENRMREQLEELRALRAQMQGLTFSVDALSKRNSIGGDLTMPPSNDYGAAPGTPSGIASTAQTPGTSGPAAPGGAGELASRAQNQFNLGNYTQARQGFEQALQQSPSPEQKVEILFWLAESCAQLKDNEAAQKYYTQLIESNPSDPKAWVSLERLANVYLTLGDKEYAQLMLEQILNNYPQYPDIDRVKATLATIQGSATPAPAATPGAAALPPRTP